MNYTRLNKLIAETGYCSRREADKLINEGRVKVNGMDTELGTMVGPRDRVTVNGKPLQEKPKDVYLAFNKPVGIECTTDRNTRNNIIDYINYHERIFPIGRLDKESQGLILLTNDGNIVNPILRAGNAHEKEYIVSVNKPITHKFIEGMKKGVPILDTVTLPCQVDQIDKYKFKIVLIQGLNRQIRRMCEYFGYEVTSLNRVRIMNVNIGNLKTGSIRKLSPKEVGAIFAAIKTSKGTEEASK
ncbi:pseudouridine synthase [Fusibacter sp. A2]|uniref:pseudouridine synthase n=1 Tax=Fusibacter sp. A2 TaxID=2929473 RepID=UPI001FAAB8FB|nr:pseudouridine synthase [Fusibacter sp. A1]MCK8061365.1 pseudouridine synthase [Fusibacter sp. A2]